MVCVSLDRGPPFRSIIAYFLCSPVFYPFQGFRRASAQHAWRGSDGKLFRALGWEKRSGGKVIDIHSEETEETEDTKFQGVQMTSHGM